jgi:hypothetical protein
VLLIRIRFLELREIFAKLVFGDQVTGKQVLNGIVNGCSRHPVLFILHVNVQRLHVEVIVDGIDFFQDRESFGSFAKSLLFKKS